MQQRGAFLDGFIDAKHAGKLFVLDLDQFAALLGCGFVHRAHRGNPFAKKAHLVHRERRLLAGPWHPAPFPAVEILARQHALDALEREGTRGVDFDDARMRMEASQYLHFDEPIRDEVRKRRQSKLPL